MQRDVKIGIAIGVLLIALIAVFWWFRHSNRNVPIMETGTTASENELPGPVVPVSPPMGVPGEIGPMAGATGAAPMATGVEPMPMGTVAMPAVTVVPPPPPPPPPVAGKQTYKVQHGDTLSSISEHFYKTPMKWRLIFEANRDKIGASPNNLKDGMELVIPDGGAASAVPGPRGSGAAAARKFIADIRSQLPPALQLLIDCGFDRRYERPISFGQNRGGAPVLEGPSTSASSLARRPDDPQE